MNQRSPRRFLRFLAAGVLNTVVGFAAVYLAHAACGASAFAANAFGLAVGFVFGYLVNRSWTFGSRESMASTAPRYLLAFAIAYAVNAAMLATLLRAGLEPVLLVQALALSAYSLAFYLLCRRSVFPAAGR